MRTYRPNVGIVVFNAEGKVLVGMRSNVLGAWQFPQGGVDEGEDILFAAQRELYEEVGIKDAELVFEFPEWIQYDFPDDLKTELTKKYKGQTQKWFLFYWNHPASDCNLTVHEREFEEVKFSEITYVLENIVSFKKKVYETILTVFEREIKNFLSKK
jgi:putative (di)nucleoside polyphosphate hydrolase